MHIAPVVVQALLMFLCGIDAFVRLCAAFLLVTDYYTSIARVGLFTILKFQVYGESKYVEGGFK